MAGSIRRLPSLSAAFLTVLLLSSPAAFPQAAPSPPVPPLDTRAKWVVGFCALTGARLSGADTYLIYSIPLLLKDRVSGVPTHTFSDGEKEAQRRRIVTRESVVQLQQLSRVRTERDELAFDSKADKTRRGELGKKVDTLLARIAELSAMDPAAVEFPNEKPVQFKEGSGQGNLFDPPQFSARELCKTADLDLLVQGRIEMVQGYLLIDIRVYDAASDTNVYSWREAAPREEIYSYLGEAADGLMRIVVGVEYALFTMDVTPGDAVITFDGKRHTAGSLFTTPGLHVLAVAAPGYLGEQRELDLPSGVETNARIALKAADGIPLTVESDPPGAAVYLDSVWQGKTPWTTTKPPLKRHLLLALDGYLDGTNRAAPQSPDLFSIKLDSDLAVPDQVQKDRRDGFYVSFGALAVALPVPMFLFITYQDYAAAAVKAAKYGYANAGSLSTAGNAFFWSSVGGAAVCVGLFTYMIMTLWDYITAADRPAG